MMLGFGLLTGAKLGSASYCRHFDVGPSSRKISHREMSLKISQAFRTQAGNDARTQDPDDPFDLLLCDNELRRLAMPAWLIPAHNPSIDPSPNSVEQLANVR